MRQHSDSRLLPTAQRGFTIIELLAVIVIIGLLAGLILGVARFAMFKSDEAVARADLERLKNAIEEHRIQRAGYFRPPIPPDSNLPTHPIPPPPQPAPREYYGMHDGSVSAFTNQLAQIDPRLNYMDPWGTNYFYRVSEDRRRFDVRSAGPNGELEPESLVPGGADDIF